MKDPIFYKLVRPLIKIYFKLYYNPKFIGLENIPKSGRFVLGGNHKNNLDCIFLISSTNKVIHFLAKDSLYKGIKKILFKNMGIIPVNRKIHDKDALILAKKVLNEDKVIGIFPEGTFNRSKKTVLPFKIGCVKMAHDTNSPIIPFVIKGDYKFRSKNLVIKFLEPIMVLDDDLTLENERLMNIISRELEGCEK